MTIIEYIIGGVLLVLAIALVSIIGLQQSKRHGLGNSIAGTGASESYLTKNKIANKDKFRQKLTLGVAIAFVVLVLTLYVVGTIPESKDDTSKSETSVTETSTATK